jgi:hypothetical protein
MATHIFAELVHGSDDIVGAVAYGLYKQTKVAWLTDYAASHGGITPSAEHEALFHSQNALPFQLQGFRDRAAIVTSAFLKEALDDRVSRVVPELTQSVLVEQFRQTHREVATELQALGAIINARRGIGGWLAEAGASFLVNVLVIVFIGVIVVGYQNSALVTSWFERKAQVPATQSTTLPPASDHDAPAAAPH